MGKQYWGLVFSETKERGYEGIDLKVQNRIAREKDGDRLNFF